MLPGYGARAVSETAILRISEQDFYDHAEEHARLTRGTLAFLVSELEPLLQIDDATPPLRPGAVGPAVVSPEA
jgi:hypothetical protein